ncbi:MAG: hypothetical protein ACLFR5_07770 [Halobacteriales archaeon]
MLLALAVVVTSGFKNFTVEGAESGAYAQTDTPGPVEYLTVNGVEDGEDIVVTATKEDGTLVNETTAYESVDGVGNTAL